MNDEKTATASDSEGLSEGDLLKARLAAAEEKAESARDQLLRASADLENTRRRMERESESFRRFALEKLLGELLNVMDSLELGLQSAEAADAGSIAQGMRLTHRQLLGVLEKYGVKVEDPQGQPFDPDRHEAVSVVDAGPPNQVVTVMQKGYRLHDRTLRPARVVVGRAPAAAAAGTGP